jgi:hypothetical protein
MFTLSSLSFSFGPISLTGYGALPLLKINRSTFRTVNTRPLRKNIWGKVNSPAYLRKNIR